MAGPSLGRSGTSGSVGAFVEKVIGGREVQGVLQAPQSCSVPRECAVAVCHGGHLGLPSACPPVSLLCWGQRRLGFCSSCPQVSVFCSQKQAEAAGAWGVSGRGRWLTEGTVMIGLLLYKSGQRVLKQGLKSVCSKEVWIDACLWNGGIG